MKDGSEVLEQRNINQNKKQDTLQDEIDELGYKITEMTKNGEAEDSIAALELAKK
jgi:hypothetical protein